MTFGRTRSVTLAGLAGTVVEVEAHLSGGLPAFMLGGLPDTRLRPVAQPGQGGGRQHRPVPRAGPHHRQPLAGVDPQERQRLRPADRHRGGRCRCGMMPPERVRDVVHLGELGLDGSIRPVRGVLPAVLCAARAGCRDVAVPVDNAAEASLVPDITVHPVAHLADLIAAHAAGATSFGVRGARSGATTVRRDGPTPDLADVVGPGRSQAALELAAAGGHHLFLLGPPGSGQDDARRTAGRRSCRA